MSTRYRLTPAQEDAIRRAAFGGAERSALAQSYGVHKRTIYRVLKRARRAATVGVGFYRATFEITDDGPVQITPWYAA